MSFRLFPSKTAKGQHFEQQAERWLQKQGLTAVARNVRFRGGELDLVMRDGEQWVFIEVKYRSRQDFGGAAHAISAAQQQRLWHSARRYLHDQGVNEWDCSCRFDVIFFQGEGEPVWLRDAFCH